MKKVLLLIVLTFTLSGCVKIQDSSFEDIIKYTTNSKYIHLKNKSYSGFSFYLPQGMRIDTENKTNMVLKLNGNNVYMYVDVISYYNNIYDKYKESANAFYSKEIKNGDNFGYLEINLHENNKYLVEIMYNYAKIEVIVEEYELKSTVGYAMLLLSSIEYNNTIIKNMIADNVLNYNEIEFNIFETANNESNIIEYDENTDYEMQEEIKDTDLIN